MAQPETRSEGFQRVSAAPGDKCVDEAKLKVHAGALGRAHAGFVKARAGFSIGAVSPMGFEPAEQAVQPRPFIERELFRFDIIWAAAGHPNGVFKLTPGQLQTLTGAPVSDGVQS